MGAEINSGSTITTGGLKITGGLTVQSVGISVTQAGVTIVAGGLKVKDDGAIITGGLSVQDLGAEITGGLSVHDSGLDVIGGGLTVVGGLRFTGGLTLQSHGLVLTGGITVNSGGLSITGTANVQSLVEFSDRRLKTEMTPIDNALKKVGKLNGIYFKWNNDALGPQLDNRRHLGLVAQEVKLVIPESVQEGSDYLKVDYTSLVPLLVEAIHELENSVKEALYNLDSEDIFTRMANLEAETKIMSDKIRALENIIFG